jgi:hypothetical protein
MGDHIAVFQTEPTWSEQQIPGCPNLLSKIEHTATELRRGLNLLSYGKGMTVNLTFSTTVVLCASLLDSLIHQWARKLAPILKLTEKTIKHLDFFKDKILLKVIRSYREEGFTFDSKIFSFNEEKNDACDDPTEMRYPWVRILFNLRSIYVHRGVYLVKSDIYLMHKVLRPYHLGRISEPLCVSMCEEFLTLITDEVIKLRQCIN